MRALSSSVLDTVVGRPDSLTLSPARRHVDPHDLAFARVKRELGWGWQTIAQALRVNRDDLRIAMGDLAVEGSLRLVAQASPRQAPAGPAAPARRARHVVIPRPETLLKRGRLPALALGAIAGGAVDRHDLGARLGITPVHAAGLAAGLRRLDLIDVCWRLTSAGWVEWAKHDEEAARG